MDNKKKNLFQFLIFAVTFVIAFFVAKLIFSKSYSDQLEELANSMNEKTPMMIDQETRLDHVKAIGDTLQYDYTLINMSKQDSATDVEGAKKFLMNQSQANLDNTPQMKEYRENNISLKYHYRDKNGQELLEFKISPTTEK